MTDGKNGSLLHAAARLGDAVCVKYLLAGGALPYSRDGDGRTPLHVAANSGHISCLSVLLDKALLSYVDMKDVWGWTVIHRAVIQKHWHIAQLLLDHGCNVNIADRTGRTVLHTAASYAHNEMIRQLISAGACLNCQDADGRMPLYLAVIAQRPQTVELLCRLGSDLDLPTHCTDASVDWPARYARVEPLLACALKGDIQCVSLLIQYGARCQQSVLALVLRRLMRAIENHSNDSSQLNNYAATAKLLVAGGADSCDTNLLNMVMKVENRTDFRILRLFVCAASNLPEDVIAGNGIQCQRPAMLLDLCRQSLRALCKHAAVGRNIFYVSSQLSIPTRLRHIITLCDIEPSLFTLVTS